MKKNRNLKKRMLPIGHALLVNVVVAVLTFLYHGRVIGDVASLFLLIAALVILAPVFFWIKPKEGAPWVSDVTAACAHLAFSGVLWGIVALLDPGRTNAMLYYALFFAWGLYACLIGLDMIIAFFRKIKRKYRDAPACKSGSFFVGGICVWFCEEFRLTLNRCVILREPRMRRVEVLRRKQGASRPKHIEMRIVGMSLHKTAKPFWNFNQDLSAPFGAKPP